MQKEDLKSLVQQMHEELINKIDAHKQVNKEQVITFLEDAINTLYSIEENQIDSIEHAKHAFVNAYKEISAESLSSYKETNEFFEGLAQVHQETIKEYNDMHIDLPAITEKFTAIQNEMSKEIERANQIITDLSLKVKTLEITSNLDALTKVFNRRALSTYLGSICSREDFTDELYLLLLDIDDFKAINDIYGHIAGDKILIFIANLLRKTLRTGDKVFRYGGEEFIVILNRTNLDACQEIASRILQLISSNQLIYRGESLNVTLSIGTTKYYNGDSQESIINRADKALYRSKTNGKNQMNSEFKTNGN